MIEKNPPPLKCQGAGEGEVVCWKNQDVINLIILYFIFKCLEVLSKLKNMVGGDKNGDISKND